MQSSISLFFNSSPIFPFLMRSNVSLASEKRLQSNNIFVGFIETIVNGVEYWFLGCFFSNEADLLHFQTSLILQKKNGFQAETGNRGCFAGAWGCLGTMLEI